METKRNYFAADNTHGSRSSVGFANTWYVLVFDSKSARDDYVAGSDNISARKIKRREVTHYAENYSPSANRTNAPTPFSGEFWGIVPDSDLHIPGLIGTVQTCYPGDDTVPEKLYSYSLCFVRRLN